MQHILGIASRGRCETSVSNLSSHRVAGQLRPSSKPHLNSRPNCSTVRSWRSGLPCSATPPRHEADGTSRLLSCYQPIGRPPSQADPTGSSRTGPDSSTLIDVPPSLRAPGKPAPARPRNGPSRPVTPPASPTVITRIPEHVTPSVLLNALLLVDKPQDWQASEVIATIKWATKAPHVIHVGSLDSMASGLLVLAFGEAARLTPTFNIMSKRYKGTVRLGLSTETFDCTGKGTEILPWKHVTGGEGGGGQGG